MTSNISLPSKPARLGSASPSTGSRFLDAGPLCAFGDVVIHNIMFDDADTYLTALKLLLTTACPSPHFAARRRRGYRAQRPAKLGMAIRPYAKGLKRGVKHDEQ